jgi:hypothetical protein
MNNLFGKVEQRFSQHMSRNSFKNIRDRKSFMLAPGATSEISQRWRKSIDINCSSEKSNNEIKGMEKLEMERQKQLNCQKWLNEMNDPNIDHFGALFGGANIDEPTPE